MSVKELERLDDQSMKAWEDHDPDAWLEIFADRFEWRDDTQQQPLRDKQDIRQYMEAWFTAFPDMRVRTLNRVIGEDAVGAEVEFAGTNTGPLRMGDQTIPATNKKVTGHTTYFAKVRDGKIVEFHSHPNVLEMMEQLGLVRR